MSDEIGHFESPDALNDPNGEETPCFKGPYIPGCLGSDFDFDGFSYQSDWPDGSARHPGPMVFTSPDVRNKHGDWVSAMNTIRFETNLPSIQPLETCDLQGNGCQNPPPAPTSIPGSTRSRSTGVAPGPYRTICPISSRTLAVNRLPGVRSN
jgi:hypothetical protein